MTKKKKKEGSKKKQKKNKNKQEEKKKRKKELKKRNKAVTKMLDIAKENKFSCLIITETDEVRINFSRKSHEFFMGEVIRSNLKLEREELKNIIREGKGNMIEDKKPLKYMG